MSLLRSSGISAGSDSRHEANAKDGGMACMIAVPPSFAAACVSFSFSLTQSPRQSVRGTGDGDDSVWI